MATNYGAISAQANKGKPKLTAKQKRDFLMEARKRWKQCVDFERENRKNYRDTMKFIHVPGEQWDPTTKIERGNDRPMYEFNHTRVTVKNVINEMRANRPTVKFRPTEDADKPIAEAREGIAKNICNRSDFDSVRDYAAEHQVGGGMAAWRVETKYQDDDSFDQDILISVFQNPLCVYADWQCEDPLKRDAKYWFVVSMLSKETYEAKYPDADVVEFEAEELEKFDAVNEDDRVWVAEYWIKKPVERHLCLLSDGTVIDKLDPKNAQLPEGVTVAVGEDGRPRERKFQGFKICQYLLSGDAILEGPNEFAGPDLPFVIVYGDYVVVDGKVRWCGVGEYMKDPQRAHNWAMTSVFEAIAGSPLEEVWVTSVQGAGLSEAWANADRKNIKYKLYNHDKNAPGPPAKTGGPQIPVALIQAATMSTDEMKASSGIFDASMGATSNETSGKAIANRAAQGRIATFNFQDNMLKGVRRTFEILNGLIPKIYDTRRSIRILGDDGTEKFIEINDGVNDLNRGKYDLTITAGPSFATQRMEAAEAYVGLAQGNPQVMMSAGDLIFKSMDLPFADQIAERLRMTLPPQIQQALSQGKQIPPEAQAALMQAEQAMQAVQQQGQMVQQAAAEAQEEKAGADKAKSEVQIAIANLKVQEAQLAADVARFEAQVANAQAEAATQSAQAGNEAEKQQLGADLQTSLAAIETKAAELFAKYAEQLAQMHGQALATAQPQVVVASPPRQKLFRGKKVNGEWVGTVQDIEPEPREPEYAPA